MAVWCGARADNKKINSGDEYINESRAGIRSWRAKAETTAAVAQRAASAGKVKSPFQSRIKALLMYAKLPYGQSASAYSLPHYEMESSTGPKAKAKSHRSSCSSKL